MSPRALVKQSARSLKGQQRSDKRNALVFLLLLFFPSLGPANMPSRALACALCSRAAALPCFGGLAAATLLRNRHSVRKSFFVHTIQAGRAWRRAACRQGCHQERIILKKKKKKGKKGRQASRKGDWARSVESPSPQAARAAWPECVVDFLADEWGGSVPQCRSGRRATGATPAVSFSRLESSDFDLARQTKVLFFSGMFCAGSASGATGIAGSRQEINHRADKLFVCSVYCVCLLVRPRS